MFRLTKAEIKLFAKLQSIFFLKTLKTIFRLANSVFNYSQFNFKAKKLSPSVDPEHNKQC